MRLMITCTPVVNTLEINMRHLILLAIAVIAVSCQEKAAVPMEWQFEKSIQLDGINPIGIAVDGNDIFLSDGDHNRIIKLSDSGEVLQTLEGYTRPMHIDFGEASYEITDGVTTDLLKERALFIPEYGTDSIAVMRDNKVSYLVLQDSLDAPAGVSVYENEIAIADFYNNRILYYNGEQWKSIGKEGKALGEFSYPTDVQITSDYIYVADAYNHRAQVFDKTGKAISFIGENQKMNAATGIYITDEEILITDFENGRVLIFDLNYQLKQTLETGIDKPTDVLVNGDLLYVTNYRNGELVVYNLKEKVATNE